VQQVITLPCGYQYYNNAGDGRSFGPELEINAKLIDNWTLSVSGSYTDSKITSPNASFQSYLSTVAFAPDGVTRPCPVTGSCTVPILNVAKDNAAHRWPTPREIVPATTSSRRASTTPSSVRRPMWLTSSATICRRTTSPICI
jgi:outer membrane receptor protein involved in Fe transport